MRPILEVGTRLGLAVSAVTLVPGALLVALARFAPWQPHWLEAVVLFGLPVACVPVFALQASSKWRHHWWAGLFALAACWFLLSPYVTANGRWIVGFPARSLAAEIELLVYGHYAWIPYRGAWAVTAAVAAVAAVSVLTWYAMVALQWIGDLAAARAPAAPVNKLADAKWASRGEVRRRFSTEGGIVLGETTAPRTSDEFDPDDPASWGRQGRGNLITLDPSKGNAHSLIFSGSGSYKTAGIAIPNALTYAGPLVIVDPKGEIYDVTAPVREAATASPWRHFGGRGPGSGQTPDGRPAGRWRGVFRHCRVVAADDRRRQVRRFRVFSPEIGEAAWRPAGSPSSRRDERQPVCRGQPRTLAFDGGGTAGGIPAGGGDVRL